VGGVLDVTAMFCVDAGGAFAGGTAGGGLAGGPTTAPCRLTGVVGNAFGGGS